MKTLLLLLLGSTMAQAQLAVTVSPPKVSGQKAVVFLAMENNLGANVESARAVCFLLDEQGKMVGQSSQWVIGGTPDHKALAPDARTSFNFVISSARSTGFASTNLTPKITFSRLILQGGRTADPIKDVHIEHPPK